MFHYDGVEWSSVENPFGSPVNGVYTESGSDEVWVTGAYGITAAYRNGEWDSPDLPVTGEHFHAVWPHNGEPLFVGGNFYSSSTSYGVIARYGEEADVLTVNSCD